MIVDFYALWCPPCRRSSLAYGKLSEEFDPLGWKFAKVDVDTAKDVAFLADIKSMPTFKLYKNGKQTAEFLGFAPGNIRSALEEGAKTESAKEASAKEEESEG